MRPIAVLYENEAWMEPLFAALAATGAPYCAASTTSTSSRPRPARSTAVPMARSWCRSTSSPRIDAVLRIAKEGNLDVGGVEYLVSASDGLPYVYDINALSNFVTDATTLVGFDPHARFARYLVARSRAGELVR